MLQLNDITFAYPHQKKPVLENIHFSLEDRSIHALVGTSGSGKSTLLKLILGFLSPDRGTISLGGAALGGLPPEKRGIGMVFQNYLLFPHLTLKENISFGIDHLGGLSRAKKKERLEEILALTELTAHQGQYPAELSGGQQQRAALARALAPRPQLLLLDEPFSNLDSSLRRKIRQEINGILRSTGITALLVTHHIKDLDMVDNVLMLHNRAIIREGTLAQFEKSSHCPLIFIQE